MQLFQHHLLKRPSLPHCISFAWMHFLKTLVYSTTVVPVFPLRPPPPSPSPSPTVSRPRVVHFPGSSWRHFLKTPTAPPSGECILADQGKCTGEGPQGRPPPPSPGPAAVLDAPGPHPPPSPPPPQLPECCWGPSGCRTDICCVTVHTTCSCGPTAGQASILLQNHLYWRENWYKNRNTNLEWHREHHSSHFGGFHTFKFKQKFNYFLKL